MTLPVFTSIILELQALGDPDFMDSDRPIENKFIKSKTPSPEKTPVASPEKSPDGTPERQASPPAKAPKSADEYYGRSNTFITAEDDEESVNSEPTKQQETTGSKGQSDESRPISGNSSKEGGILKHEFNLNLNSSRSSRPKTTAERKAVHFAEEDTIVGTDRRAKSAIARLARINDSPEATYRPASNQAINTNNNNNSDDEDLAQGPSDDGKIWF